MIQNTNFDKTLLSYGTQIATVSDDKIIDLNKNLDVYTQTTLKHLKEFLYQTLGLTGLKKKDIVKLVEKF